MKSIVGFAIATAVGVLVLALYSQNAPTSGAPVKATTGVSLRLMFGTNESQPAKWDGEIRLSDGEVTSIEGWMFAADDALNGKSGWKAATRFSPPGNREMQQQVAHGPLYPNGVLVILSGVTNSTRADIHTAQGDFSLLLSEVPFGEPKSFLNGRAELTRVPTTTRLTSSAADEDFPAAAQTPGGLAVAYLNHVGDPHWTSWAAIQRPPDNFDTLAKPTGGDQVMLMNFDRSTRSFGASEPVSAARLDATSVAIAIDGEQRTWVFWSARDGESYSLYARCQESGKWLPEMLVAGGAGNNINPVTTTDSSGRVWVSWNAFREGSLHVLAAVQQGNRFTPEQTVSVSRKNNWDPSIAAAPNGDVAIAWDTYDKGDYDVYLRRLRFKDRVTMDAAVPVAATNDFEARPSVAFDAHGRLWVAYETGPTRWGKDFGTYDSKGSPLYGRQNIAVRCIEGGNLLATADDPSVVLAREHGPAARGPGQSDPLPNPALARDRKPNQFVTVPAGIRNTIPRLTVARDGAVYLAYRVEEIGRSTAGPIWSERVLWFDGDKWRGPVVVPHSDNFLDNRPALAAFDGGDVWMISGTDHRQAATPGHRDVVNTDLYAAELTLDSTPVAARLKAVPAAAPMASEPESKAEADQIKQMQEYRRNGLRILRGEFHRHTAFSLDGPDDGPLEDAYRYLIDAAGMDWAGCCDHDNGTNEYSWWLEQKMTDAYHLGSRFVSMFSYERSVAYPEGHRNVIFAQRGIRPLARLPKVANNAPFAPAPDTTMFYQYLRHFEGVAASHQSTTVGGTDWRNNDPQVETSVEIFQGLRQNAERPDAPKSVTETDHLSGYFPAGYVSKALEKGYRLGFESSSDHFSTHESYTMVWAAEPTRQGVLDAFKKRHVYAASDNILADVRCGAHMMGDEFNVTQPPEISVKLLGPAAFAQVHIVKDNRYVYLVEPNTKSVEFTWRDATAEKGKTSFYYVRGEQADGEMVWASPMWITYQP